jgi:hypothetical protein
MPFAPSNFDCVFGRAGTRISDGDVPFAFSQIYGASGVLEFPAAKKSCRVAVSAGRLLRRTFVFSAASVCSLFYEGVRAVGISTEVPAGDTSPGISDEIYRRERSWI